MTANARYVLRAAVTTGLTVIGAVQVALYDGGITSLEWLGVGTAALIGIGGYLGIGAASTSVEPNVGNTADTTT